MTPPTIAVTAFLTLNLRKYVLSIAMLALAVVGSAASAKADTVTLQFGTNNFNQSGSLGTVTSTLITSGPNRGSIQVNVSVNAGYVIHNAGVGFNVAGGFTGITITNISDATIFSVGTARNFNGYGNFANVVDSNQSTSQARSTNTRTVSFLVSADQRFTSASQLTSFAVQIAPLQGNNTGFATTGSEVTVQAVPEPATLLLLGTGLAGIGAKMRRRRKV